MIALSRINWLHEKYPISWADKYGWRKLSIMEEEALFIFWSEIGRRMNIENIPISLTELRKWSKSGALALPNLPGIRRLYRGILVSLLDDDCREAMLQPKQPWYVHALAASILYSRKYYNRFFAFPRLRPSSPVQVEIPIVDRDTEFRMHPTTFEFLPWYKPEGSGFTRIRDFLNSWLGFQAAVPGPHLKSQGYRLEEVGPPKWEKSGHDTVFTEAESRLGCPIGTPWKTASQSE
ncbi:hypothetical protein ONZ45_g18059 [Pleurotus djamor]|nr:hypothetical protein ONZ45_g18059 [Pleurotus djamor]